VAVGLWGGLDGFLASVTLGEDESVDGAECVELRPQRGVGAWGVANARRVTHRTTQGVAFVRPRRVAAAGLYPPRCSSANRFGCGAQVAEIRAAHRT
jgi:hypothetical protein